jgi:recombinational DNA repair protein RecT
MSSEISTAAKTSALGTVKDYFSREAVAYFQDSAISKSVAKQLVLSAVIAADTAMENGVGVTWATADLKKFAADAFRLIGYGIDFGNKEAYVIPYKNTKTGKYDLTTPISADGLVKLAKIYSVKKISDVKKFYVREGDEISISHTNKGDEWTFNPVLFSTKPIIGFMTVVLYEDGTSDCELTTHEDVAKRRKASKAPNSPAWTQYGDEMGMKCAVRKHMKRISLSIPNDINDNDDEFEPVLKDMGEIATPKIETEYPKAEEYVDDLDLYVGTPLGEEAK